MEGAPVRLTVRSEALAAAAAAVTTPAPKRAKKTAGAGPSASVIRAAAVPDSHRRVTRARARAEGIPHVPPLEVHRIPRRRAAAAATAILKPERTKEKCLPQFVPLLRAGRRSKAVAASVVFHVLSDVLPGKLGATNAVVCSFCAEPFGVSHSTAEEPNLLI